jgi:preprotein translocase subunit SecE
MFKVISFKSNGSVSQTGLFKNETRKVVLAKYRQLVSEGAIVEYILVDEDGTPDLSGSY